jgi:CheY-like chemotaxis protein/signal transduction histidine kinase
MTMKLAEADAHDRATTLRSSVRKSIARGAIFVAGAATLACGAAAAAGMLFAGVELRSITIIASATAIAGLGTGYLAARLLGSKISLLAARSMELLIEQPDLVEDLESETFNWTQDAALTWTQAVDDVETVRRLIRRASRRSAALVSELEEARNATNSHDEARGQFLSRMSHELRTPLNAILGYATLLREDAVANEQSTTAADLERILVAGRNLLGIVNDLLGLTQIDAGAMNVERQVIDVRNLVGSLAEGEHDVLENGLKVHLDDDVRIMIGDAAKLRQCLQTLLVAAAESPNGDVHLSIAQTESPAGTLMSFAIGPTAPSPDDDRPASLQARRSNTAGEAGLGIAIARRLAALMGGECIVDDAAGPSFRLLLPLSPSTSEDAPDSCSSAVKNTSPGMKQRKSALIVDDDEAALDLMRRWLTELGYDVLVAHDGETGLDLAREKRPDLILLDGMLPGRSGYEILVELRSDPKIGRTPIIFVTVDDDRRRGIGCGASEYLRKPLTHAGLRAVLDVYGGNCAGEVLIIDDDDDAAELIRRGVEEVGFSTRRAHDGLEGLDMARAKPPSAIILDIGMPRLDGFGVIDRLAHADELNRIPIVVLSGHEMGLADHRRLAAAAHRVFTKGITTPREIAQSLRDVVA